MLPLLLPGVVVPPRHLRALHPLEPRAPTSPPCPTSPPPRPPPRQPSRPPRSTAPGSRHLARLLIFIFIPEIAVVIIPIFIFIASSIARVPPLVGAHSVSPGRLLLCLVQPDAAIERRRGKEGQGRVPAHVSDGGSAGGQSAHHFT